MTAFASTAPISITNLVSYLDSWNKRTIVSYDAVTTIPVIKDMIFPDAANATVVNARYNAGTKNLNFDGSNMITMPSAGTNYNNVFSTGGTLVTVIKPNSIGPSSDGRIFGKSSDGSEFINGWWVSLHDSSGGFASLKFMRASNISTNYGIWTTGRVIEFGKPHLIVIRYNDTTFATAPIITINNVSRSVFVYKAPTGTTVSDDSTSSYQLGNGLSLTRGFDGAIDVAMLYKRLLTSFDINLLMTTFQDRYSIPRSF